MRYDHNKCRHCGLEIEEFRHLWWAGDDFQCPDGESNHEPMTSIYREPSSLAKESSIERLVRVEVGWAASETNEGPDMWDRAAERLGLGSWERARTDDSPLAEELHRRRDIWIAGGWAPAGSKLKNQLDRLTRLHRRTEPNAVDVEMERLTPELAEQWLSTNGWSRVEIRSNSVLASSKNLSIWESAGDRTTVYHPVDFENLATVVHFAAVHARRNAWDILDEMTSGDKKPPTDKTDPSKSLTLTWCHANVTAEQLAAIVKYAREVLRDATVTAEAIRVTNGTGITLD